MRLTQLRPLDLLVVLIGETSGIRPITLRSEEVTSVLGVLQRVCGRTGPDHRFPMQTSQIFAHFMWRLNLCEDGVNPHFSAASSLAMREAKTRHFASLQKFCSGPRQPSSTRIIVQLLTPCLRGEALGACIALSTHHISTFIRRQEKAAWRVPVRKPSLRAGGSRDLLAQPLGEQCWPARPSRFMDGHVSQPRAPLWALPGARSH